MLRAKKILAILVLLSLSANGCSRAVSNDTTTPATSAPTSEAPMNFSVPGGAPSSFGASVEYRAPTDKINPDIAKDFDVASIQNIKAMETAYGFTFNAGELAALKNQKFVLKNLTDTTIRPQLLGDNGREFAGLYTSIEGAINYKERALQNSLFFSSDVFFDAYNSLFTELLKEMENKNFYPAIKMLASDFYNAANAKQAAATGTEKMKWTKVRNYFAVAHAIFETAAQPLTTADFQNASGMSPDQVQSAHDAEDAKVDTYDNVATYMKGLKLDATSETAVLEDIKKIYDPTQAAVPSVFADEYAAYAAQEQVAFKVDFTQFTPRSTYTSSSLRRQYFRGMKWFIMLPFFVKSPELTSYAFAATQLMAEHPTDLKNYNTIEAAIDFMVGTSDDLMPVDYLTALAAGKSAKDPSTAAMEYLVKAHSPKIKDLAATYPTVGTEQSADVLLKTKGMRFFSGKFIIDSYWTGYLTQGDEALRPGYTQKLPPMASSLEVMSLLGSDYAKSQIPKLDFYNTNNEKAINQALDELKAQNAALTDADWKRNLYTGWLWTIQSLFSWQKVHQANLPRFMQSIAWDAKTLMTASAWWTQLRHATLLYAKQSFAEMGGGGDDKCDSRDVPPPPKGYIEPQLEAYARLNYLAKRTNAGLTEQGFQLTNIARLENFIALMDTVQAYVKKELANATLSESVITKTRPDPNDANKTCTEHFIDGTSDWEILRLKIARGLQDALPTPLEGVILPAKDRRDGMVADVHTGGDSANPYKILYEGTGVPYVIFTAVSDANGPRLTIGFTFSHYEFTKGYGGPRMTDEDWQKNFYQSATSSYDAYMYTDKNKWPLENAWYAPLFNLK